MQNGVMLNRTGDDVVLVLREILAEQQSLECEVVRLRAAGGEDDFIRLAIQAFRRIGACLIDRLLLLTRQRIQAGRVAIACGQVWQHSIVYILGNRCSCRIIRINNTFHMIDPPEKESNIFRIRPLQSRLSYLVHP